MKPSPDFARLLQVLTRDGEPDRIPFVELFHDAEIMTAVLAEPVAWPDPSDRMAVETYHLRRLRFWHMLGYDYITLAPRIPFQVTRNISEDTAPLRKSARAWADESSGPIACWDDFHAYRWPSFGETDMSPMEILARELPDGMQMIGFTGGILEWGMNLMGYEGLALALYDEPELVEAVFERVAEVTLAVHTAMAQHQRVGALWLGDDMGHKHATLISADHLRQFVLPWHRRIADVAHEYGKPFLLHSCGCVEQIMDDLIDVVGIDAKHSFEDIIMPAAEFKAKYGHRVALLGGVDMDFLASRSEEDVRRYVRTILEQCAPGGGFALGSGNSLANYVPIPNFLAMLDEGRRFGRA